MNPALASLDIDPKTGVMWFTSGNLSKIFGLFVPQGGRGGSQLLTITDPLIVNPRGVAVDNVGRIAFESNGILRVFENGEDGYVEDVDNPMNGEEGGGGIVIMPRSRTNLDPAIHDGPGYANVLPTVFAPDAAECEWDLTLDDVVDGGDLGLLLGQWGADGTADFNDDDVVDGADLGLLLGGWGGCP